MAANGIHPARVLALNKAPLRQGAKFALYWMQASQRESGNHALEFALAKANELNLPLLAAFCLTDSYPGANLRHYSFMADGLAVAAKRLAARGIAFELFRGAPPEPVAKLSEEAAFVVVDAGHMRFQRAWRESLAAKIQCPLFEVEANLVVPVDAASMKEEYAARTIRPKLNRLVPEFLSEPVRQDVHERSDSLRFGGERIRDAKDVLRGLKLDESVGVSPLFKGGEEEAARRLKLFVGEKLMGYESDRNDPALDGTSLLSPYLHFGNISPVRIALAALAADRILSEPFLEELIVRRELSFNFVRRNPHYDSFQCLPPWAVKTLEEHASDKREAVYKLDDIECACTLDPAWNAAQLELLNTGRIHGYMRMYWGKRLIDWLEPELAYETALRLNDKHQLDGRDPNGCAGVAWCFGKHDRPWSPGPHFGTVRRMTQGGLRRKFDLEAYIAKQEASSCMDSPSML